MTDFLSHHELVGVILISLFTVSISVLLQVVCPSALVVKSSSRRSAASITVQQRRREWTVYHSSLRGMQECFQNHPEEYGKYADDEEVEGKGQQQEGESSDLDTDNAVCAANTSLSPTTAAAAE